MMKLRFGTRIHYLFTAKSVNMNKENFEYLSINLKYLGFGEELVEFLEIELQKQSSEFQLAFNTVFGKDELNATLHFRKSNINEMYFFDKYYLYLRKHDEPGELMQPFYIYKGKGLTCKEGYNLLCGRAVNKNLTNKEGQTYNAWLQLDLSAKDSESFKIKQYHQNYGFDLLTALSRLPIHELSDPADMEVLLKSLGKGNLQPVVFEKDGREKKMWIAANPRFKTIIIYDSNRKLVKDFVRAIYAEDETGRLKSKNGMDMNGQQTKDQNEGMEEPKSKEQPDQDMPRTEGPRPKRKRIFS